MLRKEKQGYFDKHVKTVWENNEKGCSVDHRQWRLLLMIKYVTGFGKTCYTRTCDFRY